MGRGEAGTEECPLFTVRKLEKTVLPIKDQKTPRPDSIFRKVLELVFKYMSDLLFNVFNAYLTLFVFPSR